VGHCWLIAKIKFPNKAWLQTVTPQLFVNYIDHLLGEHIWGLHVRGPGGVILASPQWAQLLEYEFRVRKAMSRTINEGADFSTALVHAMNCPITRDRYFTSPAAMSSSLRLPPTSGPPLLQQTATQDWSAWAPPTPWAPGSARQLKKMLKAWGKPGGKKGDGKGKKGDGKGKKGGGKGKKGKGKSDGPASTPDGRAICFNFNNKRTCRADCGYVHVCRYCLGTLPAADCSCAGARLARGE